VVRCFGTAHRLLHIDDGAHAVARGSRYMRRFLFFQSR
jgi:hypothetical protein